MPSVNDIAEDHQYRYGTAVNSWISMKNIYDMLHIVKKVLVMSEKSSNAGQNREISSMGMGTTILFGKGLGL